MDINEYYVLEITLLDVTFTIKTSSLNLVTSWLTLYSPVLSGAITCVDQSPVLASHMCHEDRLSDLDPI